jgi:hypothetical protein
MVKVPTRLLMTANGKSKYFASLNNLLLFYFSNLNLCKLFSASSYCTMFEKEGIYSLKDMPNEFTDYIPLSASENSLLEV